MLEPAKKDDYKSPHINIFDKKHLSNNDENMKMPDIKHIIFINDHFISERTISTQLNSSI